VSCETSAPSEGVDLGPPREDDRWNNPSPLSSFPSVETHSANCDDPKKSSENDTGDPRFLDNPKAGVGVKRRETGTECRGSKERYQGV
jgi:hypothetical protein